MPGLPVVARWGVVLFVGLVALAHPLRPDLPAAERFVSEYARGWTWPLQTLAFLGWAASTAACAVLAAHVRHRRIARALTVGGLAVASAGLLLAACFQTQTIGGEMPPGVARTAEGRLHDAGALLILVGLLLAGVASLRLLPVRAYRATALALAAVLLAIVPVLVALGIDAPGIGQRGFILVGCAWCWAFAHALTRRGSRALAVAGA